MSERREQIAGEAWSPSAAREKLRSMLACLRQTRARKGRTLASLEERFLSDAIDGPLGVVDSPEAFAAFMGSL